MTEEAGSAVKYYVLMVCRDSNTKRLVPLRAFWIERTGLTVARQMVYDSGGRIEADIKYSDMKHYADYTMPCEIRIERPLDGYTLVLRVKDWEINPVFNDNVFELPSPRENMKIIHFK